MKIKNYPIITLLLLIISCSVSDKKQNDSKTNINNSNSINLNQNSLRDKSSPIKFLYSYSNKVKIHSLPSDSSDIFGYLDYSDSLIRFDWYLDSYGKLGIDGWSASWIAVNYQNDTAWISTKEDISTTYSIDTIGNLVILNYYGYCDYGGYGCYANTIVYNFTKKEEILNSYFDIKTTFLFNDSILILTPWDNINIYDLNSDSIIYKSNAKTVTKSKLNDRLYFLRYNADSISKSNKYINEIVQYLIIDEKEDLLYVEPNDSIFQCIITDGSYCPEIKLEINDSIENITVNLYKMKQKPMDEGDVINIFIKLDNQGKLYSRTMK